MQEERKLVVRRKTRGIVSLSTIEEESANCKSLINAMPDYLEDPVSSNGAHRGCCLQQRGPEMVRVPNRDLEEKWGFQFNAIRRRVSFSDYSVLEII
jgi:hypothetical protein